MRHLDLAAVLTVCATASAQDFIHYKFDANCTSEVINLASGPAAFPGNGLFESNTSPQFVAGPFGGALAGGSAVANLYNRVRTGWTPSLQPLTGDLTFAFFAKERTVPGTALNYLCGVTTSANRLFTNGIGQRGLYFRNIVASGPTGLDLSALTAVLDSRRWRQPAGCTSRSSSTPRQAPRPGTRTAPRSRSPTASAAD